MEGRRSRCRGWLAAYQVRYRIWGAEYYRFQGLGFLGFKGLYGLLRFHGFKVYGWQFGLEDSDTDCIGTALGIHSLTTLRVQVSDEVGPQMLYII